MSNSEYVVNTVSATSDFGGLIRADKSREQLREKRRKQEEKFSNPEMEEGGNGDSKELENNTFFEQTGSNFMVKNRMNSVMHDVLPGGNYAIKFAMGVGFYLEKIEDFPNPEKIYGNTVQRARRILNSFIVRDRNLGVLLSGEKGSGKTMLGRVVSRIAADEMQIPTLFVTSDMSSEGFYQFLYKIRQPCIVFIDEYEKIYDKESQEKMLTLLDGVFQSKKLFILTCNDQYKIDSHLRNRPGRIHYAFDFKGLDREFVKEYCQDRLDDKSRINEVANISSLFSAMNFDMLQSIVWEMNTYKESAPEVIECLNAKPENDGGARHEIKVIAPAGFPEHAVNSGSSAVIGSPLKDSGIHILVTYDLDDIEESDFNLLIEKFKDHNDTGYFIFDEKNPKKITGGEITLDLHCTVENMKNVDFDKGVYTFEKSVNGVPFTIVATRTEPKKTTYSGFYRHMFD